MLTRSATEVRRACHFNTDHNRACDLLRLFLIRVISLVPCNAISFEICSIQCQRKTRRKLLISYNTFLIKISLPGFSSAWWCIAVDIAAVFTLLSSSPCIASDFIFLYPHESMVILVQRLAWKGHCRHAWVIHISIFPFKIKMIFIYDILFTFYIQS